MKTAARLLGMAIGITGLFQIILGVLLWLGRLKSLLPLHMVVGLLFVLSMWVAAAVAIKARAPGGLVALTFIWGAVVLLFGLKQAQLFPGPNHWIIRVLHLVLGVGAMGLAGGLVRRVRESAAPQPLATAER